MMQDTENMAMSTAPSDTRQRAARPFPGTPDFIIGGAPKCGTTTLHHLLDAHPDIRIPKGEMHHFDADDPMVHGDFFFTEKGRLRVPAPMQEGSPAAQRYREQFEALGPSPFFGEDSTTYIFSTIGPQRIAHNAPEAKLVFMLRDPVARAYSQYWHLVTTGRAQLSFEQAIAGNASIINGSTYAPNLSRYLDAIPKERVMVLLFEDMIADKGKALGQVLDFIGAAPMQEPPSEGWHNRTAYPRNLGLQLLANRIGGSLRAGRYRNRHGEPSAVEKAKALAARGWFGLFRRINMTEEKKPPMNAETRNFLAAHLSERNAGLSALLNRDLSAVWRGFENR